MRFCRSCHHAGASPLPVDVEYLFFFFWLGGIQQMVEQKDVHSSSPEKTPKLQLAAEQPSARDCWMPPKKYIPSLFTQGHLLKGGRVKGENSHFTKPLAVA